VGQDAGADDERSVHGQQVVSVFVAAEIVPTDMMASTSIADWFARDEARVGVAAGVH
jgi:hypothetical protein